MGASGDFIPYSSGKSYTVCGSFKLLSGAVAANTASFVVVAYDSSNVILDVALVQPATGTPTSSWQRICGTRTTFPVNTAKLRAIIVPDQITPSTALILFDDISLT